MLFSQRIIVGTANLLWWTTTAYLSMFWQPQFQFQQSYATSSELWTPNQTLLKMYRIEIIQWHCSGEFSPLTLPYITQKLEHASWNDHIVWQHINQVNRLLIIWGDCVYIYIYILLHIQCRVITRKLPNFTCTCMEAQNVEYPPPWSCQISRLWSHLALGAAKYHCLSVFARLTWYSDI